MIKIQTLQTSPAPTRFTDNRIFHVLSRDGKIVKKSPLADALISDEYIEIPLNGNKVRIPINGEMRVITDGDVISVLSVMKKRHDKNSIFLSKLHAARRNISAGQHLSAVDALTLSSMLELYL